MIIATDTDQDILCHIYTDYDDRFIIYDTIEQCYYYDPICTESDDHVVRMTNKLFLKKHYIGTFLWTITQDSFIRIDTDGPPDTLDDSATILVVSKVVETIFMELPYVDVQRYSHIVEYDYGSMIHFVPVFVGKKTIMYVPQHWITKNYGIMDTLHVIVVDNDAVIMEGRNKYRFDTSLSYIDDPDSFTQFYEPIKVRLDDITRPGLIRSREALMGNSDITVVTVTEDL